MTGYRKDLAYIHDAGFSGFARKAAPGLLTLLRRSGVKGGRVVDLGCGGGVWLETLAAAGCEVVGIDISAPMIALARRRVPRGRLIHASFHRVKLPACDAMTAIGECVNYLFDRRSGPAGLTALFTRVHAALRPGGCFLLDFAGPGRGDGRPRLGFRQGEDWGILVETREDLKHHELTRRMTIFRRAGVSYRRTEETHHLRLYRRAEMASLLRRAGFSVKHLRGYGRFALPLGHHAILARRPVRSM